MKKTKLNLVKKIALAMVLIFTAACEQNEALQEQTNSSIHEETQTASRITPQASVYNGENKIMDIFQSQILRYTSSCNCVLDHEVIADFQENIINDHTRQYVNPHNTDEYEVV